MTVTQSSHLVPMKKSQLPKADLRQPITAWKALVWAYADECVRVATNSDFRLANTGYSSVDLEGAGGRGGAINGFLEAHEDALAIDETVRAWFDFDGMQYHRMAIAAEKRKPLLKASDLKPLRLVPEYRVNGTIKMEYRNQGKHAEPHYCWVIYEGHTAEELSKAQQLYDLFVALLDVMPGLKLRKWRVCERGLTNT